MSLKIVREQLTLVYGMRLFAGRAAEGGPHAHVVSFARPTAATRTWRCTPSRERAPRSASSSCNRSTPSSISSTQKFEVALALARIAPWVSTNAS